MEHDAQRDRIIQDGQRISGCTVFDGLSCRNARARRNRVASLTGVTLDIFNFYEWFCHSRKLSQAMSFSRIDCHKSDREIEIAIDMHFNYISP